MIIVILFGFFSTLTGPLPFRPKFVYTSPMNGIIITICSKTNPISIITILTRITIIKLCFRLKYYPISYCKIKVLFLYYVPSTKSIYESGKNIQLFTNKENIN